MSELPKCKLCGNEPFEFSVQCECDNVNCIMYEVEMKKEQWRTLMGEPVSAEPVAYMLPFGDGTFTFEKTLPDYVNDIESSDWLPLYAKSQEEG